MNPNKNLTIHLEEPWKWEGLAPPEDPLGELSNFEMGLRRFCFECNHKVAVKIEDETINLFLDPDIILILDELPKNIYKLFVGQKIELDFPESWKIIDLIPCGREIRCNLRRFGYSTEQKHFQLDKTQVLESLRAFLDEILGKAVDGGYIRPEEKDEFLIPAFPTDASVVFPASGMI